MAQGLFSDHAGACEGSRAPPLHISVPASGMPPGQVPAECFPGDTSAWELTSPRRVTFASDVTVLGGAPAPMHSPDIIIYEPSCPEVIEEDVMVTEDVTTDVSSPIVPPPPGLCQFSWPREDWQVGGDSSLFTVDEELPGWSPWHSGGLLVDLPLLPLSPIVLDRSDDSVTAQVGSSREESSTPSEALVDTSSVGDAPVEVTNAKLLADSPLPTAEGMLQDLLWAPVASRPQDVTGPGDRRSPSSVPRWRLARTAHFWPRVVVHAPFV